jgi:uncharacterized protein YraI
MTRILASVFMVLVITTSLVAQGGVVKRNVNLRPTPSTAQPAIRLLKASEALTLVDPKPTAGFYHVRTAAGEDGWVWGPNVTFAPVPATVAPTAVAAASAGPVLPLPGTFAIDQPSCPPVGKHATSGGSLTAYSPTSDAGLRNMAKRHMPVGASPVTLDLLDFSALQDDINTAFANARSTKTSFAPDRQALQHLAKTAGTVSEGDLVQIAAFIMAVRPQGNESVNCAGLDGSDMHISVAAKDSTEWKGVVVEMIPQLARPGGWNAATLNKLRTLKQQVLVVGGLTYDNEHLTNGDEAHPNGTQPKRGSLWEIHPITEFYVCDTGACNPSHPNEWLTLTAWALAHGS